MLINNPSYATKVLNAYEQQDESSFQNANIQQEETVHLTL